MIRLIKNILWLLNHPPIGCTTDTNPNKVYDKVLKGKNGKSKAE